MVDDGWEGKGKGRERRKVGVGDVEEEDREYQEWRRSEEERRRRRRRRKEKRRREDKGFDSDEGKERRKKRREDSVLVDVGGGDTDRNERKQPSSQTPFGQNLFKAERYESDRLSWNRKFSQLWEEDEMGLERGFGGGFGTLQEGWEREERLEENHSPHHLGTSSDPLPRRPTGSSVGAEKYQMGYLPERWKDSISQRVRKGLVNIDQLDEEEYAEYMRDAMYRKSHATEIRAREAKEEESRRRKEEETRRAQQRESKDRTRRERRRRQQVRSAESALRSAREEYRTRWSEVKSSSTSSSSTQLYFSDLPWPTLSDQNGNPILTKDSVRRFLFDDLLPQGQETDEARIKEERKRALRSALLQYHPDRYLSSEFFQRIDQLGGQRDLVSQCVVKVAQILTELQNDL
ncbi:hypothetical protein IE53DRAFT_364364 [Violaceomyces palustris]|uniref:Uncharacterized protein n=1 Tax=Violaceomyces palustris TaxID=1673888 RepID=A0ACD0NPV6_9BASI|nr:hypothetical protein IE53DRAFT_364364 [Violaceomyces palustris]